MRLSLVLAVAAALLVGAMPAHAQTGSVKTPAAIATEINTLWPDNTSGQITPFNARQTLLDMNSSTAVATTVLVTQAPFLAACDGVTDDTAAIQAAINAVPNGGEVIIPPSPLGCIVSQAGANHWALLINKSINLRGTGIASVIRPSATFPSTVDVIVVTGSGQYNQLIEKLFIGNPVNGQRGGRHAIYIDTTAVAPSFLGNMVIRNTFIATAASGGNGIFHTNSAINNPNGGLFGASFYENEIDGGVSLNGSGDSVTIHHNVISGLNCGVYANLVAGAGNLLVIGNNMSSAGGMVCLDQVTQPTIAFNEIEQIVTNTEVNNAMIDLLGGTSPISSAAVFENQLQANGGTGSPLLVRVANASGTTIDGNRIAVPTNYTPISITAASTGTLIGASNTFVGLGASAPYTDAGTGTLKTLYTSSLQTLVDGATVTPDFSKGLYFTWTLGAAGRTLANPTNITVQMIGMRARIDLVQDGTGSRTVTTYGTDFLFAGGLAPVLSAAPGAIDALDCTIRATTAFDCVYSNSFAGSGGGGVPLRQIIPAATSGAITAGVTAAFALQPGGAASSPFVPLFPVSGRVKNLFFTTATPPGAGQSYTITLMTGTPGALGASALTCTISGAVATTCNDIAHATAVTAGQGWIVQTVGSGAAATSTGSGAGFEFDSP